MDKILLFFGIVVAIAIITTGGFGLFQGWFPFGSFSLTGPVATGPGSSITLTAPGTITEPKRDETNGAESGKVSIISVSPSDDPQSERIVIRNQSNRAVSLDGWSVGSPTKRYPIPYAEKLAGRDTLRPIILAAGKEVVIYSGRGPVSRGLLTNKCLGYYAPRISSSCPSVQSPDPGKYDDRCILFVGRHSGECSLPEYTEDDLGLSYDCQEYVETHFGYDACISARRKDADFYGDTWYVYLDRPAGLWRGLHDTITLQDGSGSVIDEYVY